MADLPQTEAPRAPSRLVSTIGGGFIVIRRGDTLGRLKGRVRPFEHPTLEAAQAEAARLAALHHRDFCVFQQVAVVPAPAAPASSTDEAA